MALKGYKLQFFYRGKRLTPTITFDEEQISGHGLINGELEDLLRETGTGEEKFVEYEIGQYVETTRDSPLSGATIEEARQAVEYLASFYQLAAAGQEAPLRLEEEKQFKLSTDRLKRVVLLLTDLIGATVMRDMWIGMLVNQLTGKSRNEMATILGLG